MKLDVQVENENNPLNSPKSGMNSKAQGGLITMVIGLLIIPSPIFLAWISTAPGSDMWNEGDSSSGAAAIWLMFLTIPFGGLIAVIGLVLLIVGLNKK